MKKDIDLDLLSSAIAQALKSPGLLLVSANRDGESNVMAIGWGLIGKLWSKPIFVAFVRPSRYTHELIEESKDFTVNLPAKGMERIVSYCGSISGRSVDKFKELGLIRSVSRRTRSPIIEQCIAHLECAVIYDFRFDENKIPPEVRSMAYPMGDYHDAYFGEIIEAYADEDYELRLP